MTCKGCADESACTIQLKGSVAINECPCRDCLIKGICQKVCEDLQKHYEEINTAYRKIMARKINK